MSGGGRGSPRHALCLGAAALLATVGCGDGNDASRRPAPSFRGPIVVISFSSLRFDAVGSLGGGGATPNLDALAAEATWAGAAIAATSRSAGSLASLFTGLPPSLHGVAHSGRPRLRPQVRTLAQELRDLGFSTTGTYVDPWLGPWFGMDRGFDRLRPVRGLGAPRRMLRRMRDAPAFLWVQIALPHYRQRAGAQPRAGEPELALADVAALAGEDLAQAMSARYRAVYRERVARADRMLGALLEALRRSGVYDRTVLVVVSDHGEELGEEGRLFHGASLVRGAIEVPLVLRLPAELDAEWRVRAQAPVPLASVFATLLELAGGRPVPAAAPSLWRAAPRRAISELFFVDGRHRLSLVENGLQLYWTCRFAPSSPEHAMWRREALTGLGSPRFAALVAQRERHFQEDPACDLGTGQRLVEWLPDGGTRLVQDGQREERMTRTLFERAHFPPPWSREAVPPGRSLRPGQFRSLLSWGVPADPAWIARP